ncbi:SAM-dependent methyltransferase [Mycolicibacterium sp. 018/SC-01/001]|uniref:SAM-dependent methyltransferase n=1 Tax=Mycolicibacterium sp. 018/SC-01/001 TaxID=2592069 RepID=UPI00163D5FA8|nr:SAM-dependent methyltransferase [Mycolicibacterium sp. 018/SC-01/001]
MSARLPDDYFDRLYAESDDPWSLGTRWYEDRKYAITMAVLPFRRYRHAFEPGCSVGVLTERLLMRCDRITAIDVSVAALDATNRRLAAARRGGRLDLRRGSVDDPWPAGPFDLVVLSEVCYYLQPDTLRTVLEREIPRLPSPATVVAAHWRHAVADYPMSGDEAAEIITHAAGLHRLGGYRDDDVVIDVFDTATADSVASRTHVPGA